MFKFSSQSILCLLLGVVLSFTQAPYDYWFLIFPIFSIFYWVFSQVETKKAVFFISFLFGLGYYVSGLNWIGNALLVEGNEYRWVWPIAVIALPCLLSIFLALSLTVAHIVSDKKTLVGFFVFCSCLALNEFIRGYAFTGFPWNLYGYTWLGLLSVSQISSLIGPYGLSFVTIIWGSSCALLLKRQKKNIIVFCFVALSFFLSVGFGHIRISNATNMAIEDVQIRIVQPNIDQAVKWKPEELENNFRQHITLSEGISPQIKTMVIWPETSIPPSLINNSSSLQEIGAVLSDNAILLAGALSISNNETGQGFNYYNSLMAFNGKDAPRRIYNKSHLVPFGEYIPFQKYIPLTPVVEFSGFQKGHGATTIKFDDYPSFSPQICYEVIFPNRAVDASSSRPDFILVVTNDAWYGDSAGPRQHFASARFRAIEQGIPVVRSANTGISGIIDPYGRVVHKIPLMESGFIDSSLPVKINQQTLYSRFGDILFFFSAGFFAFFSFFYRKI